MATLINATSVLALLGYISFLLSLPCFPSSDGPVHMYYVHVLDALLTHSNPQYSHFFHIRHLLPPYSLYYYGLLVLSKLVPMLVADKLIICVYFLSFVFGFRYLARAIGPSADLLTLAATLLLLNWPLGMGFVNFCLSLSFAFWAVGFWLRLLGTRQLGKRFVFLLMVTAIMLTHPVPLLLLLAVTGAILAVRFFRAWRRADAAGKPASLILPLNWKVDLGTFFLASLNLGYVKLFALSNPLKQTPDAAALPYLTGLKSRVAQYSREHALAFVMGHGWDVTLYRGALYLVLIVCVTLAVRQRMRNHAAGHWAFGDTFLVLGVLILVGLPFIPSQLNGLYYFADRLVICVWLCFLLAASGWSSEAGADSLNGETVASPNSEAPPASGLALQAPAASILVIVLVITATAALLFSANRLLRPAAEAVAELDQQPVLWRGKVGFILEDEREADIPPKAPAGIAWNPFYWASVHIFRHNDAVLANAPWMHETIIPVAPSDPLPEVLIHSLQEPFPTKLVPDFRASPADLKAALAADQFYVVNQQDRSPLHTGDPLLLLDPIAAASWTCTTSSTWYRICHKND